MYLILDFGQLTLLLLIVGTMSYEDIDKLTEARASTFVYSDADSEKILFPPDSSLSADTFGPFAQRLEYLKKKETRYVLHGSTLSQYWRNKRIPRGLRINKEPTIGRHSDTFCEKWCEVLNKCALDLMLLVIEHVNEELSKVRTEVIDLQNDMKSKLDDKQLKDINDRCTALLEGYKKELSEVKLRKYRRDTLDYKNNQVYRWFSNPTRKMRTRQTTDSLSSGRSTDESGNEGASTGTATHFLPQGGNWRPQRQKEDRRGGVVRNVRRRGRGPSHQM